MYLLDSGAGSIMVDSRVIVEASGVAKSKLLLAYKYQTSLDLTLPLSAVSDLCFFCCISRHDFSLGFRNISLSVQWNDIRLGFTAVFPIIPLIIYRVC